MDASVIPPTIFVAIGAAVAALLAGFFSYLSMVSAKENKVSEFRLNWIDGLREEIAEHTGALKGLLDVQLLRGEFKNSEIMQSSREERELKWMGQTENYYRTVIETLTKIELRLNPQHVHQNPDSDEAKLMKAVSESRRLFNEQKYEDAFVQCDEIARTAAPLLKKTWDLVKHGEVEYQRTRRTAEKTIRGGMILVPALLAAALLFSLWPKERSSNQQDSGNVIMCVVEPARTNTADAQPTNGVTRTQQTIQSRPPQLERPRPNHQSSTNPVPDRQGVVSPLASRLDAPNLSARSSDGEPTLGRVRNGLTTPPAQDAASAPALCRTKP